MWNEKLVISLHRSPREDTPLILKRISDKGSNNSYK
nr:MAG TPA: hypothetical protein [Caudoviricetes sp.]